MNTEVNLKVVAANRKPLNIVGSNLGSQFFKAEARASWPKFEEEKLKVAQNGDIDLILNRTPRRYRMTGYDVVSVQIANDAIGATNVYINKNLESEVSIPVTGGMNEVGKVVEDALGKALRGDKNVIFSDPSKLADIINKYNNDEIARVDNVIEKLQAVRAQIKSCILENTKRAEDYCREILDSTPSTIPGASGSSVIVTTEEDLSQWQLLYLKKVVT